MSVAPKTVPFHTLDRQWDARFNVQDPQDLQRLLTAIRSEYDAGKFLYVMVGGVEVGTKPSHDDYQVRHVHVAAVFNNRVSKASILKNWNIKQGNGYYLVPRNRELPYSGWRAHHTKVFSKVDPTELCLLELGELPKDSVKPTPVKASENEKKRKIDEVLIEMKDLIQNGKDEDAWTKFPRTYLQYGEKIKAMVNQKRDFFHTNGDPHIWLYGYPGTGKTQILSYIYPKKYTKNLYNRFFDLYDPKEHTHVILEDLDHEAVERLSVNFLKTLCDEAGFAVDQKYKTPQLARTTVLVTSNFNLDEVLPEEMKGRRDNLAALMRRFWHINVFDFHRLLGIKMVNKFEQNKLKASGNTDPGRLFITWDYMRNTPACTPLSSPETYQKLIKDTFYGQVQV